MSEFKRCDESGMCKFLAERVMLGLAGGRGLHTMETINMKTGKTTFRGVAYKTDSKDKGLMINFCPFCGKRPGAGFEKARGK